MHEVMFDAYKGKGVTLTRNDTLSGEKSNVDDHKIGGLQTLYQGYQLKIISGFLSQGVTLLVKGRRVTTFFQDEASCNPVFLFLESNS